MTKEDIEKRYNQLVNSIEKKEMYDGRGTVDRYTCGTCGHIIYTTYRDKGVTPYTIRCNRCGGTKYHDKTYNKKTVPSYVMITDWYRPSLKDVLKMSDGMIDHILNGGLILDEPSTRTDMNLNELRYKAYQCAVVHGWHEENLSDEHFLCLVVSELMEAVEADRIGKYANRNNFEYYMKQRERDDEEFMYVFKCDIKDTVEDELADACIRLLDLAGLRNVDLGEVTLDELKCSEGFFDWTFTESIYSIVSDMTNQGYIETHSFESHLRVSLMVVMSFCVKKNIDILWHIEQKIKYNELRPYKHGGKSY